MNENIDLTKILKNCPKGWEFYSSVFGEVQFIEITPFRPVPYGQRDDELFVADFMEREYPVKLSANSFVYRVSSAGEQKKGVGDCTLFPSKEQRDWSKFTAPWYKKEKFDPKTLQPFDKVVVRDEFDDFWRCEFFNYKNYDNIDYPYVGFIESYKCCIPYNEETRHLVGTTDEAPEFYRHWED